MNIIDYCVAFCALTLSAFLIWIMVTISIALHYQREEKPIEKPIKVKKVNHEVTCLLDEDGWHNMHAEEVT